MNISFQKLKLSLFFLLCCCSNKSLQEFSPMGYGSETTGGLNGDTLYVSNLNDNGPGSFRDLVGRDTARVIEFLVSGQIKLESPIKIFYGNLTINGPTSFEEGIIFINYGLHFKNNCSNVIIRNIAIRGGKGGTSARGDGLAFHPHGGNKIKNIMIDHCSIMWATDENIDTFHNVTDLTCQWTIIGGSQRGWLSGGSKLEHPARITIHHCLFANNADRNPYFGYGGPYEFINNIVYNWYNNNATKMSQGSITDIINNYYIPGPDSSPEYGIIFPVNPELNTSVYVSGNYLLNSNDGQWDNVTYYYTQDDSLIMVKPAPDIFRRPNRIIEKSNVMIYGTDDLFEIVINNVGPKIRDHNDKRIIEEIINNS